jgi:hypothetical protein
MTKKKRKYMGRKNFLRTNIRKETKIIILLAFKKQKILKIRPKNLKKKKSLKKETKK